MITSNLNLVRASVDKFQLTLDTRSRMARDEMAMALQQLAMNEIRNDGGAPQAGGPPVSRTGRLRSSIHVEKSRIGFAKYTALIGPGVVYGRALEVSNEYAPPNWRGAARTKGFPYMAPAYVKFRTVYAGIMRKHLLTGSL